MLSEKRRNSYLQEYVEKLELDQIDVEKLRKIRRSLKNDKRRRKLCCEKYVVFYKVNQSDVKKRCKNTSKNEKSADST